MSKLSKEKIEQIRKDAVRHRETKGFYMTNNISREEGYIEGATIEAEKAEVLVKALDTIINVSENGTESAIASEALSEYQSYTSATKS